MRTSLAVTIFVMGMLAVTVAVITARVYRQLALDNQRDAISDMIRLEVQDALARHLEHVRDLAQSVQHNPMFRAAFDSKDAARLQRHLDSQFHRYFVTAGVIRLEKLYAYDLDLNPLTASSEGTTNGAGRVICPNIRARARARKGPERLTTLNEICIHENRPYHAVLISVGGLRPKGYLEVVTDPSHALMMAEKTLGFPIQLRLPDGTVAYQADTWPDALKTSLVAEYRLQASAGGTALLISAARDLRDHLAELDRTRNLVLLIAGVITLLTGALAMLVLRETTLKPMRALQAQLGKVHEDKKHLGEQIVVKGSPEFRDLATGFNEMTTALKALYHDISESNRLLASEIAERKAIEHELRRAHDELEKRVEERTARLNAANEKLLTEIDQRKQAELALIAAKEEAESANQAKSRFLSRMSHELRTPLNAILGFGQLLEEEPHGALTGLQRGWLQHINQSGWYLLSLVNEILDLARIESGKMEIRHEAVALAPLILQCANVMKPAAAERHITLSTALAPCEAVAVRADPTRLKQVLLNLLSNAVKYNNEGGSILLSCAPLPSGEVRIAVKDSGAGIPDTQQDQLFQPFSRLDADKKCIEGTGIGLAISKQLMELMGGAVGVESAPGDGSTFWVAFPPEAIEEGSPLATAGAAAAVPANQDRTAATVLYIEDNPSNLLLVKNILRQHLPQVTLFDAHTAELGLQLARTRRPNIILMDINLPGMSGHDALAVLKGHARTRDIPVLAISADAIPGDVERSLRAGFHGYVTKPIIVKDLIGKLEQALGIDPPGVN